MVGQGRSVDQMTLACFFLAVNAVFCAPDLSSSDYYAVLGVAKTASLKEIKSAYRKLALEWHPDKNTAPEASENFRKVAEAYELLSDKDARARYDAVGRGGSNGHRGFDFGEFRRSRPGFKHRDAKDIFKDVFGDEDPFANFDKYFEDVEEEVTTADTSASQGSTFSFGSGGRRGRRTGASSSSFSASFGNMGGMGGMGGSGGSSVSFSFSDGRTGQKMSSTTTTDSSGRRVTKTLKSDGESTEATMEESFNGKTKRRRGKKRSEPKQTETLPDSKREQGTASMKRAPKRRRANKAHEEL